MNQPRPINLPYIGWVPGNIQSGRAGQIQSFSPPLFSFSFLLAIT
jgi:hypothetical protein